MKNSALAALLVALVMAIPVSAEAGGRKRTKIKRPPAPAYVVVWPPARRMFPDPSFGPGTFTGAVRPPCTIDLGYGRWESCESAFR